MSIQHPMTEAEAARYLGITERQVREERSRGLLKCHRIIGGRVRITPQQCDEYMQSHPCNRNDDPEAGVAVAQ